MGTYRKDLVNAEKLHYARDNGDLTMTWAAGGRVDVAIGGRSGTSVASGAGFLPRVNVMSAMVFKLGDDCAVSIVFTRRHEATDAVERSETGTCDSVGATGALNFDGVWPLVECTKHDNLVRTTEISAAAQAVRRCDGRRQVIEITTTLTMIVPVVGSDVTVVR